jgi:SAM-dependent methyltransferase
MMNLIENSNIGEVRALYERHPYPHYPLLAKPRWQDGYLGSALWAKALTGIGPSNLNDFANFLSIGSGEILPYIVRQWEPSATSVTCVDLSRRSLGRAAYRTALLGRKIAFHQGDIDEYLQVHIPEKLRFAHMEAYGVLHHIPSHRKTLQLMGEKLTERGLIRIMVYNSHARDWIWDINRGFADLGLTFASEQHIKTARTLLLKLSAISPRLKNRLDQMGHSSLGHNTRFADTFLHPWESRSTIKQWFDVWKSCGLKPIALYDRYAELDDLPNPLWCCPTLDQLTERALDLRFENNLEVWLAHDKISLTHDVINRSKSPIPLRLRLKMPPTQLHRFSETRDLPLRHKMTVWQGMIHSIYGCDDQSAVQLLQRMDLSTARRLARIGLVLPNTAHRAGLLDELSAPMTTTMSPPDLPQAIGHQKIQEILKICGGITDHAKRTLQAAQRFARAL